MERICGGCTLCCKVLEIPELGKPINVWCPFCDIGRGCKIYPSRPQSCKKFLCGWLQDPIIPESLRPDQCGVVIEKLPGYSVHLALMDPIRPTAWMGPEIRSVLDAYVKTGIAILVGTGKGKPDEMLIPQGRMAADVMNDVRMFAIKSLKGNRNWPPRPMT